MEYEILALACLIGIYIYLNKNNNNNQVNEDFENVIGANFEIF
jgi:hypothetical protein